MTCSGSRQPRQVFCPRHASKTEHKALLVSSDDGSDGSTDNDMMEDSATESTPSDASIETSGVLDREGNLTEEKPVEYSLKIWSL